MRVAEALRCKYGRESGETLFFKTMNGKMHIIYNHHPLAQLRNAFLTEKNNAELV